MEISFRHWNIGYRLHSIQTALQIQILISYRLQRKKGTNVEYTTFSAYVHLFCKFNARWNACKLHHFELNLPVKGGYHIGTAALFKNKALWRILLSKVGREYLFWEKRCDRARKCPLNGKSAVHWRNNVLKNAPSLKNSKGVSFLLKAWNILKILQRWQLLIFWVFVLLEIIHSLGIWSSTVSGFFE